MAKKRQRTQARGAKAHDAKLGAEPERVPTSAATSTTSKAPAANSPTRTAGQTPALPPAAEPRFFFGYEVAWAKLLAARIVLFGLLAVDSLLQISHAPRYGAGGFNVAQLPGLDALGPGRVGYGIGQLLCSYFLVLAACGVATRFVIPIATAIYAWLYFGSQLDSYQHHYLVALVLLLACFVAWQRPPDATPDTPVRTWAIRLILIQLGILYLWAAISKMSPAWMDGRTLSQQIGGPARSLIENTIGFKRAANLTLLAELVLAFTIWIRPAWRVALPLGVGFHAMIVYSGLEIGLFAWLMLGFYLLVVPDSAYVWLAQRLRLPRLAVPAKYAGFVVTASLWLGVLLAMQVRFPGALPVALVLSLVPITLAAIRIVGRAKTAIAIIGIAHLLAIGTWLVVDRTTSQMVDYYRFWGGSSRRLGKTETALQAYRKLVEIAPDEPNGHFRLGQLLLGTNDETGGIAALHEAQRLEPKRARAFLAEAHYLRSKRRTPEALEKARAALAAEPGNTEARALVTALGGTPGTAPPPPPAQPEKPDKPDDDAEAP
ncbi:MAG: HTTM domain-containing protein [Kofleriaceae bacterium]|nr:HTTM domain-containing protein [Kofleriaceae bacterium]